MNRYGKTYDVIVVGGGHAGIEASLAAARMGAQTLLLTMNLDTIGQMSCNPAIGGLAKGHMVKEIDALGGEMARAIDDTGIQFRQLNTRKGPAVRASRAQADKKEYQVRMKETVESQENLDVKMAMADDFVVEGERQTARSGRHDQNGHVLPRANRCHDDRHFLARADPYRNLSA